MFAVAFACADGSKALTPPPVDKAEIVYSNGGRLVQVNADGSDRKVLTRRGKLRIPGGFGRHGDRFPRVSPDGGKVLFIRDNDRFSSDDEFLLSGRNMTLDRVTGKVTEVLPGTKRASYTNLAWLPGSDRVIASKTDFGRGGRTSVVSIRLDGAGERTIFRFRARKSRFPGEIRTSTAVRLAASPDGSRFLMTRMDSWSETGYALELVEVATGKRKLIAGRAHSGAWSPEGSRFAFVKDRARLKVCDWGYDCVPSGDLFTAAGDGSGIKRLTGTKRDESRPSWSPDGSRIAFSGTVEHLQDRTTAELFSVGADGQCEVQLTNGSPASLDPEFVPGSGDIVAPESCDPVGRPALAEGRLNPLEKKGFGKRLWLGPESSQGLLSANADIVFLSFAIYGDCGATRASDCPAGASVASMPVCFAQGGWASLVSAIPKVGKKSRGVWIADDSDSGSWQTMVFSGRQITMIGDRVSAGSGKPTRRLSRRQRLALVDELRLEGGKLKARLPKLLIPRSDFRKAKKVKRFVRRNSVAGAMKKFKLDRKEVRAQLRFRQNLKRFGPVGRTSCPDTSDPWDMQ